MGTTFAFLGDEIYIKGGIDIPTRRHYGDYPQIEDGVGMVRTFLNRFERLIRTGSGGDRISTSTRTHDLAILPNAKNPGASAPGSDFGTILTGEMFAPILREQISRYNKVRKTRLQVLAIPNTYFGGDVSVAGLLTGQDYLNVNDRIVGDFAVIPKHTIKSDEPILLDGMAFDELKRHFPVPVYALDLDDFVRFLNAL